MKLKERKEKGKTIRKLKIKGKEKEQGRLQGDVSNCTPPLRYFEIQILKLPPILVRKFFSPLLIHASSHNTTLRKN